MKLKDYDAVEILGMTFNKGLKEHIKAVLMELWGKSNSALDLFLYGRLHILSMIEYGRLAYGVAVNIHPS